MKPKVLIIYASSTLSGPGKGLLQFVRHASALDYVLASFIQAAGVDTEFTEVAKSRGANYTPIIQKGMLDLSLIRQVRKICNTSEINIIQTHGYKGHVIAFVLSKILGVKWVAWAHGWTNENAKVGDRLNGADDLVTLVVHGRKLVPRIGLALLHTQ